MATAVKGAETHEPPQELARQELARRFMADFCAFVSPWWQRPDHVQVICDALDRTMRGELRRLAVFMPPRHGKSTLISHHFPPFFLGRYPDKRIIHASYGADLSNKFSRQARSLIEYNPQYRKLFPHMALSKESRSVTEWELKYPYRGGFRSVGVGSGITGHGADILVIDDPVKGWEAAYSEIQREAAWNWLTSDALTRLEPNAAVVLLATRWHEDDMSGRAMNQLEDKFEIIKMPAINEQDEALWPERFPVDELRRIQKNVGPRAWRSLYQQDPVPDEGNRYLKEWFDEEWDGLPRRVNAVWSYMDTALKEKEQNDESAIITCAADTTGLVYLLNQTAGHFTIPELERISVQISKKCRETWQHLWKGVYVEDKVSGTTLMQYIRANHPREAFIPVPRHTDKLIRSASVEPLCAAGRVRFPKKNHAWKEELLAQLLSFPLSAHDDRADAFIGALEIYLNQFEVIAASNLTSENLWAPPAL